MPEAAVSYREKSLCFGFGIFHLFHVFMFLDHLFPSFKMLAIFPRFQYTLFYKQCFFPPRLKNVAYTEIQIYQILALPYLAKRCLKY